MDRRDARREERAEQRQSKLKCFACRGMGHSAKDCPNALDAQSISLKTDSATASDSPMIGRDAVGICFRCGSTEHTLSRCRKPALKGDELPFATCFICHSKGHLSSKCPNNAGRGVYPEGGSCKLCSSVEHLAKDYPGKLSLVHVYPGLVITKAFDTITEIPSPLWFKIVMPIMMPIVRNDTA